MAFISASGTKSAARISGLATLLFLCGGATLPDTAAPLGGEVDVRFEGMRSTKGMIRACLTRDPRYFPKCEKDPAARRMSISASDPAEMRFNDLAPGDYALLVLHDENGNARVDTMLGIPREGVGFSRNPKLIMGPPAFEAVRFAVGDHAVEQVVRLKYFL